MGGCEGFDESPATRSNPTLPAAIEARLQTRAILGSFLGDDQEENEEDQNASLFTTYGIFLGSPP